MERTAAAVLVFIAFCVIGGTFGARPRGRKYIYARNPQSKTGRSIYGVDIDLLGSLHPAGHLRPGQASYGHSCADITAVPAELRRPEHMYPGGIPEFYVKYTEAYGIPIIGSANVTDHGLRRACYLVRYLLASRYDIRNAFYKMYTRVALIADNEEQTSLWEYRTWDKYWDTRARGLGPTFGIPLCSAGDENQRCAKNDRYWNQDNLVHEFSHGVHLMGAAFSIPGFSKRLGDIFRAAKAQGKWKGLYAGTNPSEYFATGSQYYFNSFFPNNAPLPDGTVFTLANAQDLQGYDPDFYNLLAEVFPCGASHFVHRCDHKECTLANFRLVADLRARRKSACPAVTTNYNTNSAEECAQLTCRHEGNAFNFRPHQFCFVLRCPNPSDVQLKRSGSHRYEVYTLVLEQSVQGDSTSIPSLCAEGPHESERCNVVPMNDRRRCGPSGITSSQCIQSGCCWEHECFYPKQGCLDKDLYCPDAALNGDCDYDPGRMYRSCPFSCGVCDSMYQIDIALLESLCQDSNSLCRSWASTGECEKNPGYMLRHCALSCHICTISAEEQQLIAPASGTS